MTMRPVAKGSRVPAWPIFSMRVSWRSAVTKLNEVLPRGLSTSKTPSLIFVCRMGAFGLFIVDFFKEVVNAEFIFQGVIEMEGELRKITHHNFFCGLR